MAEIRCTGFACGSVDYATGMRKRRLLIGDITHHNGTDGRLERVTVRTQCHRSGCKTMVQLMIDHEGIHVIEDLESALDNGRGHR